MDGQLEEQRITVACRKASKCIAFSKESKNNKWCYFLDILTCRVEIADFIA